MDSQSGPAAWIRQSDERQDKWALTASTFAILALFFIVGGFYVAVVGALLAPGEVVTASVRAAANTAVSVLFCALLWACGVHRLPASWRTLGYVLAAALVASFARNELFVLVGVMPSDRTNLHAAELIAGVAFFGASAGLGLRYMVTQHRLRLEERRRAHENLQRELALRALEKEEIKVRRSIAEGLHGSLQQRLVILAVRLDQLAAAAERPEAPPEMREMHAKLLELRTDLDRTREDDVRSMSRMLYPEGLEIGLVAAVRMLLRRIPTGIATQLVVGDGLRTVDDPGNSRVTEADRLLVVRVIEEGVTNALRHGRATRFCVELDLVDGAVVLDVSSNGALVDKSRLGEGSVLARVRERLALVGGTVVLIDDMHRPGADPALASTLHVHLRGIVPLDLEGRERATEARARAILDGWTVHGYLAQDEVPAPSTPPAPVDTAVEVMPDEDAEAVEGRGSDADAPERPSARAPEGLPDRRS